MTISNAKYTDAEAIAAIEGGATLNLSGAVEITGDLTLSDAILLGNPGIEDDGGTQRITFRGDFPFFPALATIFKVAVSGNTVIIKDGDLRMDDGDLNIQGNNLRSTNLDMFETILSAPAGFAFRIQPKSGNNAAGIDIVPSGTSKLATFNMYNDSAAGVANRVRFGIGLNGLGVELAAGMRLDWVIDPVGGIIQFHFDETSGWLNVPMRFGDEGAATEDLEVANNALIEGDLELDGTLNHDGSNVGFFGTVPTTQPTALTAQDTSITHTSPVTPDFALQDLIDSGVGSAFGFATKDEGNTFLQVVLNLQTRVQEMEDKLQALGLLA